MKTMDKIVSKIGEIIWAVMVWFYEHKDDIAFWTFVTIMTALCAIVFILLLGSEIQRQQLLSM